MSAPTVDDRRAPVAPWGVTVVDVGTLTTNVTIHDTVPAGSKPASTVYITVPTVRTWIDEVSQLVAVSICEWTRILDEDKQAQIRQAAKTITTNGVASYVIGAAFPSIAAPNTTSYAQVLWQRYKDGLAALEALICKWIEAGGDGVAPIDGPGTSGSAAWSFPPPRFPDCMVF